MAGEGKGASQAPFTRLPDDLPVMISTSTAARVADVSRRHIINMLRSGEIRGVKLGGVWRIDRSAFLRQCGLV